jgi:hypothetical protein
MLNGHCERVQVLHTQSMSATNGVDDMFKWIIDIENKTNQNHALPLQQDLLDEEVLFTFH